MSLLLQETYLILKSIMKEDIHKSLEPLRQLKMPLGIIVPISTIALRAT